MPLLPSIEQTVASAIDPISLAAECLEETSNYIEGDVREAIEHALAAGQAGNGAGPDSPRPQISSPISHSKQFSLASTRLSSACSTFRAVSALPLLLDNDKLIHSIIHRRKPTCATMAEQGRLPTNSTFLSTNTLCQHRQPFTSAVKKSQQL